MCDLSDAYGKYVFAADSYIPNLKTVASFLRSNKQDAEESKKRIISLITEDDIVCPGHGEFEIYKSSIGNLKKRLIMHNLPIVSIICTSYNHEAYITDAIEGILIQRTNFPFEVIICDDASTDATALIIKQYENKYPDIFKVFYHKENQFSKGIRFFHNELIANAQGKYIALCEGDDYWTDPNKLQKQVDFLEANTEYIGCFHNTEERYQDGGKASWLYCNYKSELSVSIRDLCYSNMIPTCSVVFRNKHFKDAPQCLFTLLIGDWPMNIYNAQYGNFWYIPHIMGVHRLTLTSIWSLQCRKRNIKHVMESYDNLLIYFSDNPHIFKLLKKGKRSFYLFSRFPFLKTIIVVLKKIF